LVDGEHIDAQYGPLKAGEVIGIGPFKFKVTVLNADDASPDTQPTRSTAVSHARGAVVAISLRT
jgi:predicted component of type VI protein secretion system